MGHSTSAAKANASKENGAKGGRPTWYQILVNGKPAIDVFGSRFGAEVSGELALAERNNPGKTVSIVPRIH